MTVKPYHFHLEKISKSEQTILESLLNFVPGGDVDSFQQSILKVLRKHIGKETTFYLSGTGTEEVHRFYNDLPDPCAVAVLSLTPLPEKPFVQIDPLLAGLVVEKLLGGEGEEITELRYLTESEQGVLEFLLMELLSVVHKVEEHSPSCHFRLDSFAKTPKEIQRFVPEKSTLSSLTFYVKINNRSGFVKIYLPHSLVTQGLLAKGVKTSQHRGMKKVLKSFGGLRTFVWGELGEATISSGELKSLERGDVVLFDETALQTNAGRFAGEVLLRVGNGEAGAILSEWKGFSERGKVALKEIIFGEIYGEENGR